MLTKIDAFALSFHLEKSNSHNTLVSEPLKDFLKFRFHSWDGTTFPLGKNKLEKTRPLLFFQYPPPFELLESDYRVVWLPMWDHIKNCDSSFWRRIKKGNIRIVAFSNTVYLLAKKWDIPVLKLTYYVKPEKFEKARFDKKRIAFYWNRIGLIGKKDLERFCKTLKIDRLIFQKQLDPGISKRLDYEIPNKLGKTEVLIIDKHLKRKEYLRILQTSNIYLAPRIFEGVGLSFIEALGRGCAVFGMGNPTFTEYVVHRKNGYRLKFDTSLSSLSKLMTAIHIRVPSILGGRDHLYSLKEDWKKLETLDLEKMGLAAYQENKSGYENWMKTIPSYYSFISDWQNL